MATHEAPLSAFSKGLKALRVAELKKKLELGKHVYAYSATLLQVGLQTCTAHALDAGLSL